MGAELIFAGDLNVELEITGGVAVTTAGLGTSPHTTSRDGEHGIDIRHRARW